MPQVAAAFLGAAASKLRHLVVEEVGELSQVK